MYCNSHIRHIIVYTVRGDRKWEMRGGGGGRLTLEKWWKMGGSPPKQVGCGMLRPLFETPATHTSIV